MKKEGKKIHFELANFGNYPVFEHVLKSLAPYFDSIGMNEQELVNFVHFFSD